VHITTAGTALADCTRFTPLLSTSAGTAAADSTAITLSHPRRGLSFIALRHNLSDLRGKPV